MMKLSSWKWACVSLVLVVLSGCWARQLPVRPATDAAKALEQASPAAEKTMTLSPTEVMAGPAPEKAQRLHPTIEPRALDQAGAMRHEEKTALEALSALTRYDIDVAIDYDNLAFEGQVVVDYTNTERTPLDRVNFRLFPNGDRAYGNGSLTVSQVMVDEQPAETKLSLEDTVLEVRLPAVLKRGASTRFVLAFEGHVPREFGEPDASLGYGVYNFSEGVMALYGWYPILAVFDDEGWNLDPTSATGDSVYSDAAFYTVDISARSDLVLAATGVQVEREVNDRMARYHYVSGPARDFFMILSPDFVAETDTVGDITVNSFYQPGHEPAGGSALRIAVDALKTFNKRFGPYPYVELDVIDAPMKNAAGVEFPGIVLIGDFLYDNYRNPFFETAVAHEVAHQWWYNVVHNDVIDEPWMDEALATYASSIYFEEVHGEDAFQRMLDRWEQSYDQTARNGGDDLIVQPMSYWDQPGNQGRYGAIVYLKGALFFEAVREEIGDEAFFRALQAYYATYQYKIASADDLLNVFEEAAGRQLDDLFEAWLYTAKS